MIGGRRVWWGAGVVLVGVGLGVAALSGSGTASADTGGSTGTSGHHSGTRSADSSPSSSATSSSSHGSPKAATARHRSAPTAVVSGARETRLNAVISVSRPAAEEGAGESDTVAKSRLSPVRVVVTRIVSAVHDEMGKLGANPVRVVKTEPKATPPARAVAVSAAPVVAAATTEPAPAATGTSALPADTGRTVAAGPSMAVVVAHAPPAPAPAATVAVNLLSALGWRPGPEPVSATSATPTASVGSTPAKAVRAARAALGAPATNGVTGVKVGHSRLNIPCGPGGYTAPADWYFPTQADGSVQAQGVIWSQHGFLADKSFYSALDAQLAQRTNSIVVAPTLTSNPLACAGCWLSGAPMHQAVADMFLGDRAALNISANAAGYQGTLPEKFVLAGHSAGGGFAASVAGYTVDNHAADNGNLLGVVMFDGVSMNGALPTALASLDTLDIPVYQIAAPAQPWNAYGITTDQLLALRPNQFDGVVLVNGSHVDSMLGSNPIIDFAAQLVTKFSPPGNTAAVYTLSTGWINDMYVGAGPDNPQYGLYGSAGQPIIMGEAAAIVLPTPEANRLSPLDRLLKAWTTAVLPLLFGGQPAGPPAQPATGADRAAVLAA